MSFANLMNNNSGLTVQRRNYVMGILDQAAQKLAQDLTAGETTREVGVVALAQLVAAYVPPTGKGHADKVRDEVNDTVNHYMSAIEEEEEDA